MRKTAAFIDYQSFDNLESARFVLINTLEQHNVPYEVASTKGEMDIMQGNVSWVHPIIVKIPAPYFEQVNTLMEEKAEQQLVEIPKQHYLLGFKNDELFEILEKPDEWSKDDYAIAKQLLAERGEDVSRERLVKLKQARMQALAKPEKVEPVWIYAGFAVALAGGLAGIFLGQIFYSSKKTLPNGKKVFTYDAESRKSGFIIFVTGIVALVVTAVVFLISVL